MAAAVTSHLDPVSLGVPAAAATATATTAGIDHIGVGLTFCSPLRLPPAHDSHEIFATISDGVRTFEVLQWPTNPLHFSEQSHTIIFQAFSARDAASFQRGNVDPLAICYIPIVHAVELARTRSVTLQVALQTSILDDRDFNWQDQALAAERFERNQNSLNSNPLGPKICIVIEQALSALKDSSISSSFCGMSTGSLSNLAAGEKAVAQSPYTSLGIPSVLPSPAIQAEESSVFGAKARTQVASAGAVGSISKLAFRSQASVSPALSRTLSPMVVPISPQELASPKEPDANFIVTWKTRWGEEHARSQRSAEEFEKAFRGQQVREKRKLDAFDGMISMLEEQGMRWQVQRHFCAWQRWMADEKAIRQFEQLDDEHEQFKKAYHNEILDATKRFSVETGVLQMKFAQSRSYHSHVTKKICSLQSIWDNLLNVDIMSTSYCAWHRFATISAIQQRRIEESWKACVMQLLFIVLQLWCYTLDSSKRRQYIDETTEMEISLPQRLEAQIMLHTISVLDWVLLSRRRWGLDEKRRDLFFAWHQACPWMPNLAVPLQPVIATCAIPWCACSVFYAKELYLRAWSAWIHEIDARHTEVVVSHQVAERARKLSIVRTRTMNFVRSAGSASDSPDAFFIMLCWKFYVTCHRLKCALRQMDIDRHTANGVADAQAARLGRVESEAQEMQRKWSEGLCAARHNLSTARSELLESRDFTAQMVTECSRLLGLRQSCIERQPALVDELAVAHRHSVHITEQLQSELRRSLRDQQDAEQAVRDYEYKERDIFEKQEELRAEAARQQEKRVADLRESKAAAKHDIAKYEQSVQDMKESRINDQQMWTVKFRQAETRRAQLEKELRATHRSVVVATPRSVGYEVERQQLEKRLALAETRFSRFEASTCEGALQTLRGEFAEVSSRHSELLIQVQHKQTELEEQRAVSALSATIVGTSSTASLQQRGHERSPQTPITSGVSSPVQGSNTGEKQRDLDLRAMLDDVQRAVRAPRGSGISLPASPASLSQPSSPDGIARKSPASACGAGTGASLNRIASEDSLPSDSTIEATMLSNQSTTSQSTRNSIAQNLARRLDETAWAPAAGDANEPSSAAADAGPALVTKDTAGIVQTRLRWLQTPPRSRAQQLQPQTPPRFSQSMSHVHGHEATADAASSCVAVEVNEAGRLYPPVLTSARANAFRRQQALNEHDTERRTLQQRVEQMRRQIDSERVAAPQQHPCWA